MNKGDVLVIPFNLDSNNNKITVNPIAEIKAEMFVVAKCCMDRQEKVLARTGNKAMHYKYKLANLDLFSSKNKNSFALFEYDVYNESISGVVPLNRDV